MLTKPNRKISIVLLSFYFLFITHTCSLRTIHSVCKYYAYQTIALLLEIVLSGLGLLASYNWLVTATKPSPSKQYVLIQTLVPVFWVWHKYSLAMLRLQWVCLCYKFVHKQFTYGLFVYPVNFKTVSPSENIIIVYIYTVCVLACGCLQCDTEVSSKNTILEWNLF